MAWTAPRTWVTGETPTAAIFNTHVRDNLNLFDAATVSNFWASDGTGPAVRVPTHASGNGSSFTFTNSSYLDLDAVTGGTPGSAIAVSSLTTGTKALVFYHCISSNTTVGALTYLSFRVSGSTTIASGDGFSFVHRSDTANYSVGASGHDLVTLTAGTNNFELQARTTAGTATMQHTALSVIPF